MITVMNSFRVPGVPEVEVYRDADDANAFHLIPDHPRIATDAKSGLPLFNFTLFSRNIEIAYASATEGQPVESQLGALTMTCDLSVPPEDWETIRAHLVTLLQGEMAQPSVHNRVYQVHPTSAEPRIGYANTWTEGTVKVELLQDMPGTFVRSSSPERMPNLRGTMTAALWANFGTEGAQLMWDALHPTEETGSGGAARPATEVPLLANVTYVLTGYARSPKLHVEIKADGGPIYKEIRERMQISERKDGQSWSYPQVSSLTKELVDKRLVTITWQDDGIPPSDPNAQELKKKLEETVLGLVTAKIVETFFRQLVVPGVKEDDLGKTFTHTTNGVPGSRLWLNDYTESNVFDLGFTLDYQTNHTFKVSPQVSLLTAFTADQRDKLVRVVDVGSPEVRVLSVPVFTNADFEGDRIANITATLTYKQFDHLVEDWIETSEAFVFRTGQETFTFRTRLARDAEGRLIDTYDARARINYIGSAQQPEVTLTGISERALTFSYDRLGYVNVLVQAGDIDWTEVDEVYVDFVYDSARSQPDAKGSVKLTREAPEGRWKASKHGFTGSSYSYTVRFLKGGTEVDTQRGTDERATMVVHDTLVDRLRRTFDVSLDPETVELVVVKVQHEIRPGNVVETSQPFTATGSWDYVRPLTEGASRDLKYRYKVQYRDGVVDERGWQPLRPDEELPTIVARRHRLLIRVDGGGLDWTRWRTVYVVATYRDPARSYLKLAELEVLPETPTVSYEVLAFDPSAREYEYQVTFVPRDGSDPVEVPPPGQPPGKRSGVLLLETLD